jgi:hypothetical protein
MIRLGVIALLATSFPAAAWSNPPAANEGPEAKSFHIPRFTAHHRFAPARPVGRAEIAPNAHFGFGIFGLKSERSYLQPVTGREIDTRKQRRAAVGFSLKF